MLTKALLILVTVLALLAAVGYWNYERQIADLLETTEAAEQEARRAQVAASAAVSQERADIAVESARTAPADVDASAVLTELINRRKGK